MSNRNEFIPFATAVGANVLTSDEFSSLAARALGYVSGILPSIFLNTNLRQSSEVSSMIGQFIADYSGDDALDDGNIAELEARFVAALLRYIKSNITGLVAYGVDTGTLNHVVVTTNIGFPNPLPVPAILFFTPAHTNTGAVDLAIDGNTIIHAKKPDGTDPTGGEIVAGSVALGVYNGTNFYLITSQATGGGGGGSGLTAVATDAPILGDGTTGNHVRMPGATKTTRGYGRVAADSEASNGISLNTDSFNLPWITPEQLAAALAAVVGQWVHIEHSIVTPEGTVIFDISAYDIIEYSMEGKVSASSYVAPASYDDQIASYISLTNNPATFQSDYFPIPTGCYVLPTPGSPNPSFQPASSVARPRAMGTRLIRVPGNTWGGPGTYSYWIEQSETTGPLPGNFLAFGPLNQVTQAIDSARTMVSGVFSLRGFKKSTAF